MTPAAPDPLAGAIPARLGPGASVGLEKATGLKNLQQLIQLTQTPEGKLHYMRKLAMAQRALDALTDWMRDRAA